MREIICVQIGQAGNQIGTRFWSSLSDEHGIDQAGMYRGDQEYQYDYIDIYFAEETGGKFFPRCVLADLEPSTMDCVRGSLFGEMFRSDNYVYGNSGSGNNFAKGYKHDGNLLLPAVWDTLTKEVEKCERLQGIQIIHAIGGGTGSGFGSLLLENINENLSECLALTCTVLPSFKMSETVVEPYNSILAMNALTNQAHETMCYENAALWNVCLNTLGIKSPTLGDLNHLICCSMLGLTASLRFPGILNSDLRKLAVNLVPFPTLHFFISSFAPLKNFKDLPYSDLNVVDITNAMFDPSNMMTNYDPEAGRYLAVATLYRGNISSEDVEAQLAATRELNHDNFVDWIPVNTQYSICSVPMKGLPITGTLVGNNTAIKKNISEIDNEFFTLFEKRAYLHWYLLEGLGEEDFRACTDNIDRLRTDYKRYGHSHVDINIEY